MATTAAIFFPTQFYAAPRPVMLLLISFLPAIAFGHVRSRFEIEINQAGAKVRFTTIGAAAILFGSLMVLNFLFPKQDDVSIQLATVFDENCNRIDVKNSSLTIEDHDDLFYMTSTHDNRVMVVTRHGATLPVQFKPLSAGSEYSGSIGVGTNINRITYDAWKLGPELVIGGEAEC